MGTISSRSKKICPAVPYVVCLMVVMATVALLGAQSAFAHSGHFENPDLTAAAPNTYNHATGGGAYDDRTVGVSNDIVESLEGGDFNCGDIVSYLFQVKETAQAQTLGHSKAVARFTFEFGMQPTGSDGVGLRDVVGVSVNYGSVQGGDGPGGTDSGIVDDGGSTATIISEVGDLGGSDILTLVIEVDDFEAQTDNFMHTPMLETVIVRIDVQVQCDAGMPNPTGNVQAKYVSGVLTQYDVDDDGDLDPCPSQCTLQGGNQTIPFQSLGDFGGLGAPLIVVSKLVTTEFGDCATALEELPLSAGNHNVKYCYEVMNIGTVAALNVGVMDDAATPANEFDDPIVSETSSVLMELGGNNGQDLAAGATATFESPAVPLMVAEDDMIVNIGTAMADGGLMASDTATVTGPPSAPGPGPGPGPSPIPEPSTLLLLVVGLAAVVGLRLRHKKS